MTARPLPLTAATRQEGGIAVYILGVALAFLLLVGGLGLADTVRATAVKTAATRALVAATQSGARLDARNPAAVKRAVDQVLAANLYTLSYHTAVQVLPSGGKDPLTGRQFDQPSLETRLEIPFRLQFLGAFLPEIRLRLSHVEPFSKRKATP